MLQQPVEFSDDDDVNDTHVKGGAHSPETRGGNTANVSSLKHESPTERPNKKDRVEGAKSKIQRESVDLDAKKDNDNLANRSESNTDKNSQASEDTEPRKERHCDSLSLIVAVIAIVIALYTQLYPRLHHTPENVEKFHESHEFKKQVYERLSSVESSVQEIKQIKSHLEGIETKIKELELVVFKSDIDDPVRKEVLDNLVRAIRTDLLGQIDVRNDETKKVLQDEVQKLKAEIDVKVVGIKEEIGKESQSLEKKNAEVEKEMSNLQTNVQTLKQEIWVQSQSQDKKNDEVAQELSQHNEILLGLKQSEEKLGNSMKYIATETTVLNKETEYMKENMFDKVSMIVVIMINTTLLVLVIIYLVATRVTHRHVNVDIEHQQTNNGVNQNPSPYSTAGRILSQILAHPRLERNLCIISFYEETHPLHMRMTHSVIQQLNLGPVEFIIRRHEDILKIPPVVLYFLFVDFNERNVILEDPTLGLGDLRLTTIQAIQKMGGKIVIFYVKDPNSRQLDSRILYNKNLASVRKQRELSALDRISRFISSYDSLTDFQITHLRQIVENELDDR